MGRDGHAHLTPEHLIEAFEKSKGFILGAKKYIKYTFGYDVAYKTIKSRIHEWGMQDWIDDIRKELVENCMQRTFAKAIQDGDNHCIFWVLEKYGHHIDFLDSKETETQSKKGWKELLDYVKADLKSDTEAKSS